MDPHQWCLGPPRVKVLTSPATVVVREDTSVAIAQMWAQTVVAVREVAAVDAVGKMAVMVHNGQICSIIVASRLQKN